MSGDRPEISDAFEAIIEDVDPKRLDSKQKELFYFLCRETGRLAWSKEFGYKNRNSRDYKEPCQFYYVSAAGQGDVPSKASILECSTADEAIERFDGDKYKLVTLVKVEGRTVIELKIKKYDGRTKKYSNVVSLRRGEAEGFLKAVALLATREGREGIVDFGNALTQFSEFDSEQMENFLAAIGDETVLEAISKESIANFLVGEGRDALHQAERYNRILALKKLKDLIDTAMDSEEGSGNAIKESNFQGLIESHPWLVGMQELGVVHVSLEGERLEQLVQGASIFNDGYRPDALLQSLPNFRALKLVELKLPTHRLLKKNPPRSGAFAPTADLVDAVAQVQATVAALEDQSKGGVVEILDDEGIATKHLVVRPESLLVIGNTENEFIDHQTGEVKWKRVTSFERYRSNLAMPRIITYNEMLENAAAIVNVPLDKLDEAIAAFQSGLEMSTEEADAKEISEEEEASTD